MSFFVGLITINEVILAGHGGGTFSETYNYQKNNNASYLTIGNTFRTITPACGFNAFGGYGWYSYVFGISGTGVIDADHTNDTHVVRPVINLKSTLKFTGDGTKNNSYIPSL